MGEWGLLGLISSCQSKSSSILSLLQFDAIFFLVYLRAAPSYLLELDAICFLVCLRAALSYLCSN